MTSLVPYRAPQSDSDLDAAFADFLRIDVASGDASDDTIRNCRSEVELWISWCFEQGFDPATATVTHIKGYRQALIEATCSPITIRWKRSARERFRLPRLVAFLDSGPAIRWTVSSRPTVSIFHSPSARFSAALRPPWPSVNDRRRG